MQVSINKNQLDETQAMLKGLGLDGPKILTRALNKTAKEGQTRVTNKIAANYTLPKRYIKGSAKEPGQLRVIKANYKKLTAKLTAKKRGILMPRYSHTVYKKGGVGVTVNRHKGRKKMEGAFKTTVRAGSKTVEVIALPATGRYATGNRKMKVLYAPSVSQLFNKIRDQVDDDLMYYFEIRVEKELATVLRGY